MLKTATRDNADTNNDVGHNKFIHDYAKTTNKFNINLQNINKSNEIYPKNMP